MYRRRLYFETELYESVVSLLRGIFLCYFVFVPPCNIELGRIDHGCIYVDDTYQGCRYLSYNICCCTVDHQVGMYDLLDDMSDYLLEDLLDDLLNYLLDDLSDYLLEDMLDDMLNDLLDDLTTCPRRGKMYQVCKNGHLLLWYRAVYTYECFSCRFVLLCCGCRFFMRFATAVRAIDEFMPKPIFTSPV